MSAVDGRPLVATPALQAAVARYHAGCTRDGECLIRDVKRYGWLGCEGKSVLAHRASFAVHNGPLADGELVRHTCDRPQCVEPTHLLRGSVAQNARDMWERGRQSASVGVSGEANPGAVLTDDLVATMRREVRQGTSIRQVARHHGVGYSCARSAILGLSWGHVAEPAIPRPRPNGWRSPHRTPDSVIEQARAMSAAGASLSEIGAALGLNRVTVHRRLKAAS